MNHVIFCILVLALAVIAIAQERSAFRSMDLIPGENRKRYVFLLLCSIFNAIWAVWSVVMGVSILVFLTGMYASFLVSFLLLYKENSIQIRFCQMKFVVLTAVTLVLLGIACLFGNDVQQVSRIREVRLFVMLGAEAAALLYTVLHKGFFAKDFGGPERDSKKRGLFQGFLLCCLVYIYADGLFAIFDFGGDFVPALMISGNILILILMFLFYRFDYAVEQKEYLEKEHQQLIEEKARELWRAEQLRSMAERDALTNAYSRGYAVQRTALLRQDKIPFLIIYIDMDRMKEVNDTRGHLAGDLYLKDFVDGFSGELKEGDFIARIGGDEFLVVMCRCRAEDGKKRMEEISMQLPEYSFSYGIASGEDDVGAMIERADRSMYNLKREKSMR